MAHSQTNRAFVQKEEKMRINAKVQFSKKVITKKVITMIDMVVSAELSVLEPHPAVLWNPW